MAKKEIWGKKAKGRKAKGAMKTNREAKAGDKLARQLGKIAASLDRVNVRFGRIRELVPIERQMEVDTMIAGLRQLQASVSLIAMKELGGEVEK